VVREPSAPASPKEAIAATNPQSFFPCINTPIDMGIGSGLAVTLSFVSCIWLPATLLCCLPWVQKRE
jgi:hypothetical protein